MDYSKITNNEEVIKLLIQRRSIENQIMKIDNKALINYELESLAGTQANGACTSYEALHIGNVVNRRELLLAFCTFMQSGTYDSHNTTNSQDVDAFLESQ